jgi:hypothetical protein
MLDLGQLLMMSRMSRACPKMVSPSWNEHRLLMQCPGRVQDMSRTRPGHVQRPVHLELFRTCSGRTFPTKMMVHLKIKITYSTWPIAMPPINTSIGHPTTISRKYMPSTAIWYNRHEQRINIPPAAAPRQSRVCTNGQKTNNLSRRRISSLI